MPGLIVQRSWRRVVSQVLRTHGGTESRPNTPAAVRATGHRLDTGDRQSELIDCVHIGEYIDIILPIYGFHRFSTTSAD